MSCGQSYLQVHTFCQYLVPLIQVPHVGCNWYANELKQLRCLGKKCPLRANNGHLKQKKSDPHVI